MGALLIFTTWLAMPLAPCKEGGTIAGTVFNASQAHTPAAGTEVVLQYYQDGQFVPLARTTSDDDGQFLFEDIPLSDDLLLIGASRDGVYYPGERFRLAPERPRIQVKLTVYDSVLGPSPLVALRHEIVVRPESGLLHVSETLLIANPSSFCYAGQSSGDKGSVTLQLHVPSTFEKVTFHKEFYGRRFVIIDGKVVTTIPWPPGQRELSFEYILPIEKQHQVWERPLDLPCSDVCVRVASDKPNEVSCNLAANAEQLGDAATFASRGTALPAGHLIRVEFGRLPVPFAVYGRWIALGFLVCVIMVVSFAMIMRRFANRQHAVGVSVANERRGPHKRLRQKSTRVTSANR